MCSGMVHPEMVIHALNQGANGVMITGCRLGECHYHDGNHKALARAEIIKETLSDFGFENEQFQINWLSAAEPNQFAIAVKEMHAKLLNL